MEKFDEKDGVWRTIGGRRIFIRTGQSLSDAMRESGKFKTKSGKVRKEDSSKDIKKDNIDKEEYELFKKAMEKPDSIDPMTENSTDWEALEKKYKDRYEKETSKTTNEWLNKQDKDWLDENGHKNKLENKIKNFKSSGDVDKDAKRLEEISSNYFYDDAGIYNENIDSVSSKWAHDKAVEMNKKTTSKTMNEAIREKASKTSKKERIEELRNKFDKEQNIFKKAEISEEIHMLQDDFKGTREEYRKQIEKEQEKRLRQYQQEKEKRQKEIRNQSLQDNVKNVKTQKGLKSMADNGLATDITRYDDKQTKALREKHGRLEKIKILKGVYGANGALLRSPETGEYFVITSRNSNLFYWV